MDNFLLMLKRAPARVRDSAFALACRLLLPIATTCKVCNMLRGIMIGMPIGGLAMALIHHIGWVS